MQADAHAAVVQRHAISHPSFAVAGRGGTACLESRPPGQLRAGDNMLVHADCSRLDFDFTYQPFPFTPPSIRISKALAVSRD